MWYWSFDAIIYPFNEVILGSWCGGEAPDHRREAVHSLLWFYTEAQGVVQAELRRCAVLLWGISSSEKFQGEEKDSAWVVPLKACHQVGVPDFLVCHLNKVTGQRPLHSRLYLFSSVLKGHNKSQICSLYFSLNAILINHQSPTQWLEI